MTLRNLVTIGLGLLAAAALAGGVALAVVLPNLMFGGPR